VRQYNLGVQAPKVRKDRRGGHPAARAQIERLNAEGIARPQTAAIKHGAYLRAGSYMSCDRCPKAEQCRAYRAGKRCQLEEAFADERRVQIEDAVRANGGSPTLHGPLIDSLIIAEMRCARLSRYIAEEGETETDDQGREMLRDVSKELGKLQKQMIDLLKALGLTPAQIMEQQMQHQDASGLTELILRMDQQRSSEAVAGREDDVIDVECEEGDGE
jgi:adenine-specific DNA glycosylase